MREGAIIRPLDARYRSPYGVLVREWKKLLVEIGATLGLHRPSEAVCGCRCSSCGAATST